MKQRKVLNAHLYKAVFLIDAFESLLSKAMGFLVHQLPCVFVHVYKLYKGITIKHHLTRH